MKSISSFAITDKLFVFVTSTELIAYDLVSSSVAPIAIPDVPLKQILVASQSSQPYPGKLVLLYRWANFSSTIVCAVEDLNFFRSHFRLFFLEWKRYYQKILSCFINFSVLSLSRYKNFLVIFSFQSLMLKLIRSILLFVTTCFGNQVHCEEWREKWCIYINQRTVTTKHMSSKWKLLI